MATSHQSISYILARGAVDVKASSAQPPDSLWNENEPMLQSFEKGKFVALQGVVQMGCRQYNKLNKRWQEGGIKAPPDPV